MNTDIYLLLILALFTIVFILDTSADVLNLNCLDSQLPDEFKGVYDQNQYTKSLTYQKESTTFEVLHRTIFFIITILFFLLGGFNLIDHFARSFGLNTILTGLIFVGSLSLSKFLVQLPFSIYDTFKLEAKYGFNKTTLSTFFSDLLKGMTLGTMIGAPLFAGIIYFFETAGTHAWLYSWIAFTALQIILIYLAPALIMPLFNKFTPLPEGPLRIAIETFARGRNFQLSGIYTMDSSRRSTKSNAFFTGFGKFRRLVLFDTLISKHSQEELVAILAHEIGHYEKKHILKSMIISILSTGVIFYTFSIFMNNKDLFSAFKMNNLSVYASVTFVGFVYSPILRLLSLYTQFISRKHEFEADRFAIEAYGHREILISALKKLSIDNFSHLTPHPLKIALDYSHPPILKRLQAIRS